MRPANMPTRTDRGGTELEMLVLASDGAGIAAVDLASGAFVRAELPRPMAEPPGAYDVVTAVVSEQPYLPDPAKPEAVLLKGEPEPGHSLRRRQVDKVLRRQLLPGGQPLLGFLGPATPYWEVAPTRPSLALLQPASGPIVFSGERRSPGEDLQVQLWCRFGWDGAEHQLLLEDPAVGASIVKSGQSGISGKVLASVIGFEPRYLLLALTPPRRGHCYKVVVAVLPRP
ncbi:MAG: hypothetical protein ACYDH5_06045 [Acidimicrobiales bacterium]